MFKEIVQTMFLGGIVLGVLWFRLQDGASQPVEMARPSSDRQSEQASAESRLESITATPSPAPPAQPVGPRVFYDQTTYVAQNKAFSYVLTASAATEIKVVVDIDNTAPIELRIYRGVISSTGYEFMQDKDLKILGAVVGALLGPEPPSDPEPPKPTLKFAQEGVYRHFETGWLALEPGDYSIIVDNTGSSETPSRGDAPVRVQVMEKRAP